MHWSFLFFHMKLFFSFCFKSPWKKDKNKSLSRWNIWRTKAECVEQSVCGSDERITRSHSYTKAKASDFTDLFQLTPSLFGVVISRRRWHRFAPTVALLGFGREVREGCHRIGIWYEREIVEQIWCRVSGQIFICGNIPPDLLIDALNNMVSD